MESKEDIEHNLENDLEHLRLMEEMYFSKNRKEKKIFNFLFITAIIGTFFSISLIFTIGGETKYVSKLEITSVLESSINNGADLRAIKNIYNNRKLKKKSISYLFSDWSEYYNSDTPLSVVLEDIRSNVFLEKLENTDFVNKLDGIISEHYEVNPFDKLENSQKDFFKNIRIKIGDKYDVIQPEVNKIADELDRKNNLVNEYLKDSNISFWVSVTALIFSLIIGVLQLVQSRSTKLQEIVFDAVSKVILDINTTRKPNKNNKHGQF